MDGDNRMRQMVRIRVEICFAYNAYACLYTLYIGWSGELELGSITGSLSGAFDTCLES